LLILCALKYVEIEKHSSISTGMVYLNITRTCFGSKKISLSILISP